MHPPTRWACLLLLACALLRGAEPTVTPAALDLVEDQAPVDLRVFNLAPRAGSTSSATLQLLASVVDATVLAATVAAFDRDAGTATIAIRPLADANGTTQVVITLVDPLGVVGSAVVPVAVGAQNDIPRFQSWSPYFMGRVSFYTLNRNATRMTDPDGDAIRYTLIALPQHGRLLGPLGPARPMGLGEVFTQTDIDELRISYEAAAPTLTNDSLRVAIDDGHAPTADGWMQMSIVFTYLGEPSVPGIGLGASPAAVWTEGAAALAVCPGAWVDDMDSPAMKGGRMVARITAGAAADDRLSLVTTGFGADDITLGEGTVSYGGVPMGEASGGDGRPLTVAFTTDAASPAAAGALLRALRFSNDGRNPGSAVRTVELVVDDGSTGASPPLSLAVQVVPVDDPPAATTTAIALPAGVGREVIIAAADPDSPLLTWTLGAVPAGIQAELLDAAGGRLRLAAPAGSHGRYRLPLTVGDGTTTTAADLDLMVTAAGDPRPHPAADLPAQVWRGDRLQVDIPFDCSEVPGAELDFFTAGAVPAGLDIAPLGPRSVRLVWQVAADEPLGHRSFALVAVVRGSLVSGVLPLLVLVRPPPQGGG